MNKHEHNSADWPIYLGQLFCESEILKLLSGLLKLTKYAPITLGHILLTIYSKSFRKTKLS